MNQQHFHNSGTMDHANSDISNSDTKVQHVNKKSSDELLRKFAETEDRDEESRASPEKKKKKASKRRRRSSGKENDEKSCYNYCESPSNGHSSNSSSLVERRSLLAPVAGPRKSAVLRQLGIHSRAQLKAREIRHKSLFGTIEKTWRRTVDGASKVFMKKHYYNRHKRLINDIV